MTKTQFNLRPLSILLFSAVIFACSDDLSTANPADDVAKAALLEESAKAKSTCDDGSDPICGVCNPVENLAWLRDEIANYAASETGNYSAFVQGTYENQTVFVVDGCCPSCLCARLVWNCEGQLLNGDPFEDLFEHITDQTIVWRGANYGQ